MQEYSKITCLKCKNESIVPAGGVKDLPSNYFMDNLINKLFLNYKLENETELRCEECDEDDSMVVFCTDCKLFLCHYCKESHKYSKSHCSHNLISLTELRSNKDLIQSKSKFPTCQEHDLELEYYCETCEKLVCLQCTREHDNHEYNVAKKFANKYQSELNKVTAPIEVMIEDLSKVHNSVEDIRTAIRQKGDEISEEVDLYYDEVIEKLLEQKEKVKQQVRDTVLQKEKALTGQLEEVVDAQEDLINVKRISDAIQESSDQEVLSAHNQILYSLEMLTEKCEMLGGEPIESANIKVTPDDEPLPQVVKHFATIDSLAFEAKNFNSSVQRGQTAILEMITKDNKGVYYPRGGCEVSAVVMETRTGERTNAQIVDNNDGIYIIYFAAQHVGKIDLSVFVNGSEIKESPFRVVVQENSVEPNKVITSLDDDSFGRLWGIACSNDGMWAVTDFTRNCVHVFDSQDKLIKRFGSRGYRKNGQFICPFGVAFDNNNKLYVTDRYNHRVQKFDANGNYVLQFGGKGDGEGQLNCPIGITTHQDKVYVADRENHRISVFKNDGKFYSVIGQQQLSKHFDIAININSEILAADWGRHCLYNFTLDGHCINHITLCNRTGSMELKDPCSVTTDSNGFIFIADTSNHYVSIFNKIGNCICCFGSDDQLKFPCGIAIAPNGNIYVSDTGNNRVQIFPGLFKDNSI